MKVYLCIFEYDDVSRLRVYIYVAYEEPRQLGSFGCMHVDPKE